jgi:hypothetical protein
MPPSPHNAFSTTQISASTLNFPRIWRRIAHTTYSDETFFSFSTIGYLLA